jgi:S-adenosylmethionine decarboxylase proenzyme
MTVSAATTLYAVDLSDCHALAGMRAPDVVTAFTSALERAGAHVVTTASHSFPGAGMTVVLILAESHAVLHTWPETGTVNIDIFSCSTRLKSLEAITDLSRLLGAARVSTRELPRVDGRQRAALSVPG